MSCQDPEKHVQRRCMVEGIAWAPDALWKICPSCGEETVSGCFDEVPMTMAQSRALAMRIQAERQAELDAAEAALDRVITAATAALNYDLDRWMTDGADWITEGAT